MEYQQPPPRHPTNWNKVYTELSHLSRGIFRFFILVTCLTIIIYLIYLITPRGVITADHFTRFYPFIYSFLWGITLGSLYVYGSNVVGNPIHKIVEEFYPRRKVPLSTGLTETLVLGISLVFEELFKRIFQKLGDRDVRDSLIQTIIGVVAGRLLVLYIAMKWADYENAHPEEYPYDPNDPYVGWL